MDLYFEVFQAVLSEVEEGQVDDLFHVLPGIKHIKIDIIYQT